MALEEIQISDHLTTKETLKINFHKQVATATISGYQFVDKDTKQIVMYFPSLEVSSYGDTTNEAKEMLETVLDEYFKHLLSLSEHAIAKELKELGWMRDQRFKKDFSKLFVDAGGELQGLNAEGNKVQRLTLQAS